MLLEQILVNFSAFLDIIHPLPSSRIQSVLSLLLCIVIPILSIGLSELLVLCLKGLQIALKVVCEAEVGCVVERLAVQTREEK